MYFDKLVACTVNVKGAKEVKVKTAGYESENCWLKLRTTVILCCMDDGRKLPPYNIFKRSLTSLSYKAGSDANDDEK